MAKLFFCMNVCKNVTLDGCVDHMAFDPGHTLFLHDTELSGEDAPQLTA